MAFLVGANQVIDNDRALVNVGETVNDLGNTGTSKTINLNNGTFVTATLTANCTFTFSNPVTGASSFSLILKNDGTSSRSITWPPSVKWPSGAIPARTTVANRVDVYTFVSVDSGTIWYGSLAQYNYI
jgi:hypothetical protein